MRAFYECVFSCFSKFYTFSKVLIFSLASVMCVLVAVMGATTSRFLRRRFGMVLACIE
jgi:hypothetical protein